MSFVPSVFVTNFNRNFTGVSATVANVFQYRVRVGGYSQHLVGVPLLGCPGAISRQRALVLCRRVPSQVPFHIWHVRRNDEMRFALFARDVLRLPIKIVFTSAAIVRHSRFPLWLISKMDAVIATSERAAACVPHVRAVVPHGIQTELFVPRMERLLAWRALGYGGSRGIATPSRIREQKGIGTLVDSLIAVMPGHREARALIIGKPGYRDRAFLASLKRCVEKARLSQQIIFVGELPHQKLRELLPCLSGLVVIPHTEPFGLTVGEGMAAGLPIVASNTGYFKSLIGNESFGELVAPKNTEEATSAIDRLLSLPEAAVRQQGEAARCKIEEHFDIRGEVAAIEGVYQALYAQYSGGSGRH